MIIVEVFSCSGGMAEGLRRAGLGVTMAFDWAKDACDSYERNLGHRPVQMDVRDLLRMVRAGWRPLPHIDLFVADPPCTPWSRAGKRLGIEDERDMLGVTCDLIAELRPETFLIANVPGLDDGPNWHVVQQTIGGLAGFGYCVADFARLDAADYGVPQHRVRPFWFGHLEGSCMTWPARTHGPRESHPTLPGVAALRPYVTCLDALGHLSPEHLGEPIKLRWREGTEGPNHRPSQASQPSRTLTRNTHSDGSLLVVPHHPISPDAHGLSRTVRAASATTPDKILAWPWPRPATTVTCRAGLPPPGHHPESGSIMFPMPGTIKLSERAAAILQGFPESWHFAGKTKRARWAQIGMAMPPPFAEAVARSIASRVHSMRAAS